MPLGSSGCAPWHVFAHGERTPRSGRGADAGCSCRGTVYEPGETGGATEPEDDTRLMTDTTTTRHSIRRVSTGSRHRHVAYQERQRNHVRGGSNGRRRARRPERTPDVDSEAIAVVKPQVLAVLEQHMMEASWAVHMSVSEAAALRSRLADSHT